MPLLLVLAFLVVPLVELWVIVEVGGWLGFWPTILLLVADSVLGAVLVRREGVRAWRRFREALAAGRVPGDEIVQGALLLFGGALLLTPGFVTDVLGLALVLPFTRSPIARALRVRAVPVPLQTGASWWNSTRPPAHDAGGHDATASDGGPDDGEPSVEVLSVERDEPAQVEGGGDRGGEGSAAREDPERGR